MFSGCGYGERREQEKQGVTDLQQGLSGSVERCISLSVPADWGSTEEERDEEAGVGGRQQPQQLGQAGALSGEGQVLAVPQQHVHELPAKILLLGLVSHFQPQFCCSHEVLLNT